VTTLHHAHVVKLVGHVYAPDEGTAIKKAIDDFQVELPRRKRLLAIRDG
jgi:hypothetical protein